MKTRKDIEDLKTRWLADPISDLSKEPGFEQHAQELQDWMAATKAAWQDKETQRKAKFAEHVSLDNHPLLAEWVRTLIIDYVDRTARQIEKLRGENTTMNFTIARLKEENDTIQSRYMNCLNRLRDGVRPPDEIPF